MSPAFLHGAAVIPFAKPGQTVVSRRSQTTSAAEARGRLQARRFGAGRIGVCATCRSSADKDNNSILTVANAGSSNRWCDRGGVKKLDVPQRPGRHRADESPRSRSRISCSSE